MRILLISTVFNALTQRIYCECIESDHIVSVQLATSDEDMCKEVEDFSPDVIICPFLKRFIPSSIYEKTPTFIVHPGIRGDKGPHSLDHAVLNQKKRWGVSIIRANSEFDGGDIYAEVSFDMRNVKKASLYRIEVSSAASKAVEMLLKQIEDNRTVAVSQPPTPMHKVLKQGDRKIDWKNDTTEIIIRKINAADSHPGLLDNFLQKDVYLFGACKEELTEGSVMHELWQKSSLKEIFAKRDGAVCVKSSDGAVWISHLKEPNRFKLPATYVLKDALKGVKEQRIPLVLESKASGFHEISLKMKSEVAYLYFDFHNGAFSSEQSIRLKYAVKSMQDRCKVLVLMGSEEFFSNGIHLNILEDSKKTGEDGWSNINAMNDMVRSVLLSDEFLTIAAFRGGAGAGGLFLGLACDYVVAREGVVLNPHYKTIGLSGSEFHSYTLPKRVGEEKAFELLNEALPVSAKQAKKIGLVDEVFSESMDQFFNDLDAFAQSLVFDENTWYDNLDKKRDRLQEDEKIIQESHKKELETMYPEFWDEKSIFHELRRAFVYKQCSTSTPQRLKYKESRCMSIV